MAVEPYLEKCTIFPSGPQGVVGLLSHPNEPLVTRIGKLESAEYFLRFVNDPLIDSDIWVWWGISSALLIGAGWFISGWRGAGCCSCPGVDRRVHHLYPGIANPLAVFSRCAGCAFFLCTGGCSDLVFSDPAFIYQRSD